MAQGELKRKPELFFFCPRWSWLTHHRVCLYIPLTKKPHARTWPVCRRHDPYHSLLTSMIYNQFFHLICWGLEAMDNLDMQTTSTKLGNYLCTRSESSLLHTSIWYVTNRLRDWVSKYNVCEFLKCKSMNYYKYIFSKSTWLKK